jgi:hypothetical protein
VRRGCVSVPLGRARRREFHAFGGWVRGRSNSYDETPWDDTHPKYDTHAVRLGVGGFPLNAPLVARIHLVGARTPTLKMGVGGRRVAPRARRVGHTGRELGHASRCGGVVS